jgi:hypothetical protein
MIELASCADTTAVIHANIATAPMIVRAMPQ